MKKMLLLLVCIVVLWSGCGKNAFTWKSNPKNSTLQITTPHGTIDVKMAENLTAQEQVLLSHAMTTHQIYALEVVEQEASNARRDDYISLIKWFSGCATLIVCSLVVFASAMIYKSKKE